MIERSPPIIEINFTRSECDFEFLINVAAVRYDSKPGTILSSLHAVVSSYTVLVYHHVCVD